MAVSSDGSASPGPLVHKVYLSTFRARALSLCVCVYVSVLLCVLLFAHLWSQVAPASPKSTDASPSPLTTPVIDKFYRYSKHVFFSFFEKEQKKGRGRRYSLLQL
jgi:hypothetical protein